MNLKSRLGWRFYIQWRGPALTRSISIGLASSDSSLSYTDVTCADICWNQTVTLTLSNWPEWQAAGDKQVNQHFDAGTICKATPCPSKDPTKVGRWMWRVEHRTERERDQSVTYPRSRIIP